MTLGDVARLLASVAICEAAGLLGAALIGDSVATWYTTIEKPSWTPPGSVIGAVWTVLFALMGVALFWVWRRGPGAAGFSLALGLFAVQLILNVGWSWAFFGLRSPATGLAEIAVLWLAVAATIVAFARVSGPAAVLLAPYLAWVTFASYLTFTVWRLNRPG